jgi:serine/threonine protein kinase
VTEWNDAADPEFAALLASYDEALAEGRVPCSETVPERVRQAQRCLDLLERVWPRATGVISPNVPAPPLELGRFSILRELGRGGYGIVYLAFDPTLNRNVALKVPRPEALLTPALRQRFLREARAAAALDHPGIVPVHDAGESGAVCYIASAYCGGPTLAHWLRTRTELVPARAAAQLVADLADAVQHAHDRGVLHRDLKTNNVLLEATSGGTSGHRLGTPRLTDFGLAKIVGEDADDTRTGAILGTPAYMAPEQAESRFNDIGPHTDVYALGAILYELLTDRPPFKATSALETLEQVRLQEPVPPSKLHPRLPRDLETICLKCLAKDPRRRYPSARELADDLGRFLRHEPIRARPPTLVTRVTLWARRPERIRDAEIYLKGVTFLMLTMSWMIILSVFVFRVIPVEHPAEGWAYIVRLHIVYYVPLALTASRVTSGRAWPLWIGFVLMIY